MKKEGPTRRPGEPGGKRGKEGAGHKKEKICVDLTSGMVGLCSETKTVSKRGGRRFTSDRGGKKRADKLRKPRKQGTLHRDPTQTRNEKKGIACYPVASEWDR